MTFGAKSSTFEQRFFKPDALSIYVQSGFNIINCSDYKFKICPEILIKNNLILLTDS